RVAPRQLAQSGGSLQGPGGLEPQGVEDHPAAVRIRGPVGSGGTPVRHRRSALRAPGGRVKRRAAEGIDGMSVLAPDDSASITRVDPTRGATLGAGFALTFSRRRPRFGG